MLCVLQPICIEKFVLCLLRGLQFMAEARKAVTSSPNTGGASSCSTEGRNQSVCHVLGADDNTNQNLAFYGRSYYRRSKRYAKCSEKEEAATGPNKEEDQRAQRES